LILYIIAVSGPVLGKKRWIFAISRLGRKRWIFANNGPVIKLKVNGISLIAELALKGLIIGTTEPVSKAMYYRY
jgi:hypothetical protein